MFLDDWTKKTPTVEHFSLSIQELRYSLDFRLFRDIVLLRTVRTATSTYGDTYYDQRGKTDGAQVALPGVAGNHDT